MIFKDDLNLVQQSDHRYHLEVAGIANFFGILKINEQLENIPLGSELTIDVAKTRLVGITVLEHLYDFQKTHQGTGGTVHIVGLDQHSSSIDHHLATKVNL